jgi:hypothetical protein
MEATPRRRRALSAALAVFLAVESVSAVAAAAQVSIRQRSTGSPAEVRAPAALSIAPAARSATSREGVVAERPVVPAPAPARTRSESRRPAVALQVARISRSVHIPKAATNSGPRTSGSSRAASASPSTFRGRNHVWIPSLGINRSVYGFPCSRSRPPDNYVYRWGCAGRNNVYLLGHAYSVFKPLHDAYVNHRLRVGMRAYYADGSAHVHAYRVIWWRLTAPTTSASWAWASLSKPSMTLQTCVGARSQYRLMVRLVRVG